MKIALYTLEIPDLNTTPPLGPLMLIACLENKGFSGRLFDGRIDESAFDKMLDFNPDIIGFSVVTAGYLKSVAYAEKAKQRYPDVPVIFGGPHPTILPDEVIAHSSIDYVLTGESEFTFTELCLKLKLNDTSLSSLMAVNNLVFKHGNKIIHTDKSPSLSSEELSQLPIPAFDRMDLDRYFSNSQTHGLFRKGKRILPVMTSRGCPHNCTFCCRIMGKKIRSRSIESVISEIRFLVDTYNIDEIYIEDDNFSFDRKRALTFLQRMQEFKPRVYLKFANGLRADLVDKDLLLEMKKANVYYVGFGIESGCNETLKRMKKGLNLAKAKENILLAKSLGFKVGANCIIGYPDETLENIDESLKFFFSLPLDSMAIVNLIPFPGTEVHDICKKKGYLTEYADNWDNYYFSINDPLPLIATDVLTKDQLINVVRKTYRKMYLRPKWIVQNLKYFNLNQLVTGFSTFLNKKNN